MAGMRALPDSGVRDPDRSVDPCRRRWFPVLPAHGTDRTHPPDPVGGHRSSSWCRSQDGLSMPELMNRLGRNDKTDVPGHLAFFVDCGTDHGSSFGRGAMVQSHYFDCNMELLFPIKTILNTIIQMVER